MAFAEERLEAASQRLEEIASSLLQWRVIGVAVWAALPSLALAAFALGALSSFSGFAFVILALSASIAAAIFSATFGNDPIPRSLLSWAALLSVNTLFFHSVATIFFPRETDSLVQAPHDGSSLAVVGAAVSCLDENHVFSFAVALTLAAVVTYRAFAEDAVKLSFPLVPQSRVHRVRSALGVVISSALGDVARSLVALLAFPLYYPLFAWLLLFVENFFFELPFVGIGKVEEICGLGESSPFPSLRHYVGFSDFVVVLYFAFIVSIVIRYIRAIVEIVLTEPASFDKLKDQFQDGSFKLNGVALLITAMKKSKEEPTFALSLLRYLAFQDAALKAQFSSTFRREVFTDDSALYLNTMMTAMLNELRYIPKAVEAFSAFRVPKPEPVPEKKNPAEEIQDSKKQKKKWFDTFLEKYLKFFESVISAMSDSLSSNVRESHHVRAFFEEQLRSEIFTNFQLKIWATQCLSIIVLKSREEDKIGLVQLNGHLQNTLSAYFEALESLAKFNVVLSLTKKGDPISRSYSLVSALAARLSDCLKQSAYSLITPFASATDLKSLLKDHSGLVQSFIDLEQ